MNRWLFLLLVAAPVAVLAKALHAHPLVPFVLAALGLIPLAGLIGQATEMLAERLGHKIGGLLNATFGNAAEIIIGLAALGAGLPEVVRASLAGSIIGNILLVLGSSMLLGGWRYRLQHFDRRVAGQYAVMLALVVIGVAIPSLLATVGESMHPGAAVIAGNALHQLSIGVAVILLLCYVAYIASSIFGVRAPQFPIPVDTEQNETEVNNAPPHATALIEEATAEGRTATTGPLAVFAIWWKTTLWLPLIILAAATAVTAVVSEVLVGTIEPLTHQIGLNPFFVGLIILPIVGNAAEHFSAITSATHNRMEISLAITAGSSIQIALLAAPILVLAGPLLGTPLDLNFSLLEVAMFGLVAGLYALISLDGESTWLEGLLLCAFYLILAVGAFFVPACRCA
ncbi:MAG: calcium/proton exchanger [Chloroflexi bacterium]|nr:calcium/proton exchanger [Ktedonobacteraceae bacterium]MBV9706388.1 calcium/proton exchanger [Chloroflexota bacterium]